ncbi:hypothetical protein ABW19_dt0204294 [Dactylella cylindrospora]|nr:hypothetical protein ABW19_dt0204294 [Dactylella cylindrospora]
MSLPRTLSPLLSSTRRSLASSLKSRYRPSPHAMLPSICASCLRRSLQTATAYRPETLDIPAVGPSIQKGGKDVAVNTEVRIGEERSVSPLVKGALESSKGVPASPLPSTQTPVVAATPTPEPAIPAPAPQSAQAVSQSTAPSTTPTPAPAPAPRKFRPRKAALTLTPLAVNHIRSLTQQTPPKLIRVGVKHKGCSGLSYNLEYIEKPGKFDEVVEQDGAKVFIDSKALFSIIGSEMDWVEDLVSAKFVFKNPNIKEACGCGESFMVHSRS